MLNQGMIDPAGGFKLVGGLVRPGAERNRANILKASHSLNMPHHLRLRLHPHSERGGSYGEFPVLCSLWWS